MMTARNLVLSFGLAVAFIGLGCSEDFDVVQDQGTEEDSTISADTVENDGSALNDTAFFDGYVPYCHDDVCVAGPDSAPNPMEFGPFPVGVQRVVWEDPNNPNPDDSARVLKVEIWYPTTEAYRDGEKYAYDPKIDGTDAVREKFADVDIGTFPSAAVWEAPVRTDAGKFPLVLFSHGAYGIRYQSVFYTAQLASHGYVVVAPDHQLNTLYEIWINGWNGVDLFPSALARPLDLIFLMDQMQARGEDPEDEFYGLLNMDKVASTGHSFGGLTSYLVTGDSRIKAIIPMAPEGSMVNVLAGTFYAPFVEELVLPTLMMGGVMDKTLDYEKSQWQIWETQQAPKWFLKLNRGGHYTFTDVCRMDLDALIPYWDDADDALLDGCDVENNWNYLEAHAVINMYAIGFLNHFLRDSVGSAEYLTAEAGAEFGDEIEFFAVPE